MLIERDYLNNSPGKLWVCPAATVGYWMWPEWEQARETHGSQTKPSLAIAGRISDAIWNACV